MLRRWKTILGAVIALAILVCGLILYTRLSQPRVYIGILTAFGAEAAPLIAALDDSQTGETVRGVVYTHGWLNSIEVIVMETGSGMVNGAARAQHLLDAFPATHLIFSGVAGGLAPDLSAGMVVAPEFWINHQFEAVTSRGRAPLVLDLTGAAADRVGALNAIPADGGLLSLARDAGGITVGGTGVSGDVFVASAGIAAGLRERFGAVIVDMESAAVAQVALINNIPFIAIRGISDSASDEALSQMQSNVEQASGAAARATIALIQRMR